MKTNWSLADTGDQTGRVAIVTGANTGLGYETALGLAGKGANVVLACRSRDKADTAREKILTAHPNASVEVRIIDTGSLASVRAFAESFQQAYDRLDLLINNAGIMITPYFQTQDGFEGQLGVNYLGHFLLTGLLLPLITQTPGARIVSLYSIAAGWGEIHFDDLHFSEKYDAAKSYGQSKLACLMFALELDKRLREAGHDTLSLAAHPGFSQSDLSRNLPAWIKLMLKVAGVFMMQSTAAGAQPTLYAALGGDLKGGEAVGPDGKKERRGPPAIVSPNNPAALDDSARERLWQTSEALCGIKYPL